jgi:hypothetical protein
MPWHCAMANTSFMSEMPSTEAAATAREKFPSEDLALYYQGNRVLLRFITDCVRSTAREWNNLTRARRNSLHRRAKASGVEGKFALDDVVELTWIMAVHDRRPAAGWHPKRHRKQCVAGLRAGSEQCHLVNSQR